MRPQIKCAPAVKTIQSARFIRALSLSLSSLYSLLSLTSIRVPQNSLLSSLSLISTTELVCRPQAVHRRQILRCPWTKGMVAEAEAGRQWPVLHLVSAQPPRCPCHPFRCPHLLLTRAMQTRCRYGDGTICRPQVTRAGKTFFAN